MIEEPALGLAVDLGTTNLGAALLNLRTGARLADDLLPNPQASLGTDVMTRLQRAQDEQTATTLRQLLVQAVGDLLRRLCARSGTVTRDVTRVAVVGNSVMLALLTGHGVHRLLEPEEWVTSGPGPDAPVPVEQWRRQWGLAGSASVEVLARLGGFVGSDLLAGILATGLTRSAGPALLIDVGTNSELALWDGHRVLACSAAGGPAFEGVGVSCGMPAVPGAVVRVEDVGPVGDGAPAGEGGWRLRVLGDGEPTGVCGSGLVDVVAALRRAGRLTAGGRLLPAGLTGVAVPGTHLTITHRDLDLLQRAKAAIGAGCQVLLGRAGLAPGALDTLHVAGAFGSFLDVGNAVEIGLIPPLPARAVRIGGNTALAGCERYLRDADAPGVVTAVRELVAVTNLAAHPDFERLFFENLLLRRLTAPADRAG